MIRSNCVHHFFLSRIRLIGGRGLSSMVHAFLYGCVLFHLRTPAEDVEMWFLGCAVLVGTGPGGRMREHCPQRDPSGAPTVLSTSPQDARRKHDKRDADFAGAIRTACCHVLSHTHTGIEQIASNRIHSRENGWEREWNDPPVPPPKKKLSKWVMKSLHG